MHGMFNRKSIGKKKIENFYLINKFLFYFSSTYKY